MQEAEARHLSVFGIVQGVGFRPFVYRLARRLGLRGWVCNTSGEVAIHVEGPAVALEEFERLLATEAPPLARISRVVVVPAQVAGHEGFTVAESLPEPGRFQPVPPDVAVCPDCLGEMADPGDRRHGYAFTNCTNCGPRYTIIEGVPYDRAATTMSGFPMCPDCLAEYEDPSDRRFHAQPTACPVCGPRLWLEVGRERVDGDVEALDRAARLLLAGQVLALKGLGGFHLAVDAGDDEAVARLRRRKDRPHKALAIMAPDVATVRELCLISPAGERALAEAAAPIVLLPRRERSPAAVSPLVAPDNDTLGVMLPYTPLHHLLLARVGRPLVMTSGNLSEEPLAVGNDEARARLGRVADGFLMHDRPIHTPCDDSVVTPLRHGDGSESVAVWRRARGYAPAPLPLPFEGPPLLATGPEMKATVCLARDGLAFLSQHIGDLWNLETWEHYRRIVEHLERLFAVAPEAIAHDLHPDFMSTAYAGERAAAEGLPLVPVQQHHAHALSCLVEHGIDPRRAPVLAAVFDGTAYGSDGRVWGGEWLLLRGAGFERVAHLSYMPLPGGEAAIRHVDRMAAGYLLAAGLEAEAERLPALAHLAPRLPLVEAALRGPASVPTSSMGRLFDVVAGLLGLARAVTYEAQAAIRLETLARRAEDGGGAYAWQFNDQGAIDVGSLLAQVVADTRTGTAPERVALRFHATVADMVAGVCRERAAASGAEAVVLSGGCFQNTLLSRLCEGALLRAGLRPLAHGSVPCNDGGVALGQAAAARLALGGG